MGQIYSNQSGSVKAYYTPPIPGTNSVLGNSVAMAYAQGARTPGELATQTMFWYVKSVMMIILVVGIIYLIQQSMKPRQKFQNIEGMDETPDTFASYS